MITSDLIAKPHRDRLMDQGRLVSAIICTHNRRDLLAKTVYSLQGQHFPKNLYEIIVVDNASTDGTRDLVEEMRSSSKVRIRYIHEARLGVSHARNAGLEAAHGELTAYIDDDEEADPSWLQGIVDAFSAVEPEPGIVFGPVNPSWERKPPDWLSDEFRGYLSIVAFEPKPAFVTQLDWFPEGNSAFRTHVLRSIGGFATEFGRKGGRLLGGECLRVQERLLAMGYELYYQPSMGVKHFIPAERMSVSWLSRRAYFQGITDATYHFNEGRYSLLSRTRWACLYLWRVVLKMFASLGLAMVCLSPSSGQRERVRFLSSRFDLARKVGWFRGFWDYAFCSR